MRSRSFVRLIGNICAGDVGSYIKVPGGSGGYVTKTTSLAKTTVFAESVGCIVAVGRVIGHDEATARCGDRRAGGDSSSRAGRPDIYMEL